MAQSLVDGVRPSPRVKAQRSDLTLFKALSPEILATQGNNEALRWDMSAFESWHILVNPAALLGMKVEGSSDGQTWLPIDYWLIGRFLPTINRTGFMGTGSAPVQIVGNRQTRFVRLFINSIGAGRSHGVFVTLSQQRQARSEAGNPLRGEASVWSFVSSSPITAPGATALAAAVTGDNYRQALVSLELANGGTTGTEVILTDSVASTVLYKAWIGPGASLAPRTFDPPVQAVSNNGGININISAASGAAVYANAYGMTALGQ